MATKKACVFLILCVFVFVGSATGCAQKAPSMTVEKGVLSVGVEIGYPPMEYFDAEGNLLGFDIDLTKALAEKLGLKVKYIDTSWENILLGLDTDRYDIVVNVTITPERQKKYNFTKHYIESFITFVTLKDSTVIIDKAENIEGLRAAFQVDTTAQFYTERLKDKGVKFASFSYDKIINCFDDLKLGRVDLIVVDNLVAYYYTEMDRNAYKVAWFDAHALSQELIAFCLKNGNTELTDKLNTALLELYLDGTVAKMSYNYFG